MSVALCLLAAPLAGAQEVGPPAPSATVCGAVGRPDCPPGPMPEPHAFRTPALVYGGLALADLGSTEACLARPACGERNPLMRRRPVRVGLEVAAWGVSTYLDARLQHSASPRRVWILRGAMAAATAWMVRGNLEARAAAGRVRK